MDKIYEKLRRVGLILFIYGALHENTVTIKGGPYWLFWIGMFVMIVGAIMYLFIEED